MFGLKVLPMRFVASTSFEANLDTALIGVWANYQSASDIAGLVLPNRDCPQQEPQTVLAGSLTYALE